mmetsp:Transcript_9794/g.44613  ORF Transcript_9794/g.44613 Transcript_9794/m.44613 type:complete len:203 (+) Transcript_9794:10057-10665(+)
MSVCSLRLMRTRLWPAAFASADIRLVLPTPGEPSRRIGFGSCIARRTLAALRRVDGAESSKPIVSGGGAGPRGMAKGAMPKMPSRSMNAPSPVAAVRWSPPGLAAASIAACASGGSSSLKNCLHCSASPLAISSGRPRPRPRPSRRVRYAPCANASAGANRRLHPLAADPVPAAAALTNCAHATKSRVNSAARAAPRPAISR